MFGTYNKDDVNILLKDITGLVEPLPTKQREALIQSGVHYSEMLPLEYQPSEKYLSTFHNALKMYAPITARSVAAVAQRIWLEKGENAVLVSLARAGTPIGILIKHYLDKRYSVNIPHYTISIIRGRGIDKNAMNYILSHHSPAGIQFVDGWTGKGAIKRQLDEAVSEFKGVSAGLAVLSDPAYIAEKCGTHEDFLIASSCLNSTVSGLLSRTFYRADIIGEKDFHGAVFYENLLSEDLTYHFINTIECEFDFSIDFPFEENTPASCGMDEVREICEAFSVKDINLVKPGIGEATRVLLRRMPWKLLVQSLDDSEHLAHLYQLAQEKGVEVMEYPLKNYRACGIIQNLADN